MKLRFLVEVLFKEGLVGKLLMDVAVYLGPQTRLKSRKNWQVIGMLSQFNICQQIIKIIFRCTKTYFFFFICSSLHDLARFGNF